MEISTTSARICSITCEYLYLTFHCVNQSSQVRQTNKPSKAISNPKQTDSYAALKEKRAWELAFSPAKSLPMQAFMLYMSGGGVQIFSMGIVFMLLFSPFKNVAAINTGMHSPTFWLAPRVLEIHQTHRYTHTAFAPFAPSRSSSKSFSALFVQKVFYILANMMTLALGLYKCNSMGLLPMGTGDWLAFETRGPVRETALEQLMTNANMLYQSPEISLY